MFARNVDGPGSSGPRVRGTLGAWDYRAYVMDREGHVLKPPEIVCCNTDEEAVVLAKQHLEGEPIEVWLGAKRVGRLEPDNH
jgi:hypothetical protein